MLHGPGGWMNAWTASTENLSRPRRWYWIFISYNNRPAWSSACEIEPTWKYLFSMHSNLRDQEEFPRIIPRIRVGRCPKRASRLSANVSPSSSHPDNPYCGQVNIWRTFLRRCQRFYPRPERAAITATCSKPMMGLWFRRNIRTDSIIPRYAIEVWTG